MTMNPNDLSSPAALDALWDTAPPCGEPFDPAALEARGMPEAARRYLEHAIAPGAPLASAVRLRMHGEFKMKQWYPFTAEQVIRTDGEMLWRARIAVHGIPITGFDSLIHGTGGMQWKLFSLLPLVKASGPEITRSAVGRIEGESLWLPSLLCRTDVVWLEPAPSEAHAYLSLLGEETELAFTLSETGAVERLRYPRWGNPEGGAFHYAPFGGIIEEEATFGAYTIPSTLRIGWHFGTPRFEAEGEFFRVTIDEAHFR